MKAQVFEAAIVICLPYFPIMCKTLTDEKLRYDTEDACYAQLDRTVQHAVNFIYNNNMVEHVYVESWACRESQTSP